MPLLKPSPSERRNMSETALQLLEHAAQAGGKRHADEVSVLLVLRDRRGTAPELTAYDCIDKIR